MTTLDTHRESRGEGLEEAETPQAADGDTRTVSPKFIMGITYLDNTLSKSTIEQFANGLGLLLYGD